MNFKTELESSTVKVSVPCRLDFGGTLDISTFYLPLSGHKPSTFNVALDMRTTVTLKPWEEGMVKISSRGFESSEFPAGGARFDHPLGLMFAVADYFNAAGVHIHIESSSPPRSALGGSSSAATALCAAFLSILKKRVYPAEAAWIAHYIESSVAGVPCGMQDQLSAAFGGVNQWFWFLDNGRPAFRQKKLLAGPEAIGNLNSCLIVAYCGNPHVSSDINGRWVKGFIKGENRGTFKSIARLTDRFSEAVGGGDFSLAGRYMNEETRIRMDMTPDVLDETGRLLFDRACRMNVGARFTGAGGGGCIWALGERSAVAALEPEWKKILEQGQTGKLLETAVDSEGIKLESQ
ncbi:MAG: galactokinase [Desulfobacteraceae bacterium]